MNEELQSMNDQLHYGNEELRERQQDVDRLNDFMSSVLSSMDSAVAVIDTDLQILAWNERAVDLWGLRADEAIGEHLMNLDIGLPLEEIRDAITAQLSDGPVEPQRLVLTGRDRRGRPVTVRVTLTDIRQHGATSPGAMIAMEVAEDEA